VDKRIILPKVDDKKYISKLIYHIRHNRIQVLIPGGDIELPILARYSWFIWLKTECHVLVCKEDIVEMCMSKSKTYQWCRENGIDCPPNTLHYPLIIKPDKGWASNDTFTVNNDKEMQAIFSYMESRKIDAVLQDKIEGREITCEVVKTCDKVNGIICMEREIKKGTTYRCRVIREKRVFDFIYKIANRLRFVGVINIQILDDGKKLYLMEINSRFSGTTGIRNYLGFNSIEQMINYTLFDKEIDEKRLNSYRNGRFLRYWEEVEA
jgi:carbamoyl-phosphate synthase large subunit